MSGRLCICVHDPLPPTPARTGPALWPPLLILPQVCAILQDKALPHVLEPFFSMAAVCLEGQDKLTADQSLQLPTAPSQLADALSRFPPSTLQIINSNFFFDTSWANRR